MRPSKMIMAIASGAGLAAVAFVLIAGRLGGDEDTYQEIRLENRVGEQPEASDDLATIPGARADKNIVTNELTVNSPQDLLKSIPPQAIRKKYVNSPELPDGIAFSLTLAVFESLNEDNPVIATAILADDFGIEIEEAEEVLNDLLTVLRNYEIEADRMLRQALCEGNIPKMFGDDVYSAFEQIEDNNDAIAEQFYLEYLNKQPADRYDVIQRWIDDSKLETVSIRFNHSEYYQHLNVSADARAAEVCIVQPKQKEDSS